MNYREYRDARCRLLSSLSVGVRWRVLLRLVWLDFWRPKRRKFELSAYCIQANKNRKKKKKSEELAKARLARYRAAFPIPSEKPVSA